MTASDQGSLLRSVVGGGGAVEGGGGTCEGEGAREGVGVQAKIAAALRPNLSDPMSGQISYSWR